jgi:1-acyl-sn-glycerol-3-phosphate acyltransferase
MEGRGHAPAQDRKGVLAAAWSACGLLLYALVFAILWPLVVLAPTREFARAAATRGARLLLRASATPVRVGGAENLCALRLPAVLVANHTSELDSIVLAACLPVPFSFVAKAELRRHAWLRWPLARLGTLFVVRDHGRGAPSQTEAAAQRLRAGDSLLFFPEATFRREGGLLPFHRGAFVAAARAGVPVVPIAIRGAREMTPGGATTLRRGAIELDVGAPLAAPRGADEAAAAHALRHAARAFLLARTGEPDLARKGGPRVRSGQRPELAHAGRERAAHVVDLAGADPVAQHLEDRARGVLRP